MSAVIDIKTRKPVVAPDTEQTETQRIAAFVETCGDAIWVSAKKICAVSGLDAALRALGAAADDLRKQGRK